MNTPLQILVDLGLTDDWQHMFNSTVARAHSQAPGAKGAHAEACGRSRDSFRQDRLIQGGPQPNRADVQQAQADAPYREPL